MMSPNISNIAITAVKDVVYHYIIYEVSKSDTIHLLENSLFDDCGSI